MSASSASPSGPGKDNVDGEVDRAFGEAMRQAAGAAPGVAERPGQFRVRLQQRLGPERSARLRARVHHVVVAAEELVPATLSSMAPVTESVLHRVASDLAARRGWTFETAYRATLDWALALGVADEQVRSAEPPAPAPALARRLLARLPDSVTSLVGQPGDDVPPGTGPLADGPLADGHLADGHLADGHLAVGHVVSDTEWPRMTASVTNILRRNRFSAPAGAFAYAGRRRGLLMVAPEGLVFVRLRGRRLRPGALTIAAPWADVQVKQTGSGGFLSFGRVELGGRAVRVSPKGRRLLAAIQAGAR